MTEGAGRGFDSSRASAPHLSVLLPVHQAVRTLPAALRSLQRQTEPNWHCVLVDDGSDDGSWDVALAAAREDARFEPVRQSHAGIVAALQRGLALCRGEFVARMDADDLAHRERFAAQLAPFTGDAGLAAVGSHVRLFPRQSLGAGWRRHEAWLNSLRTEEDIRRNAFVESPLVHPTLIFRRGVLEQFPYRECGWPEDYDLLLRLLAAGQRIGTVPRRLLAWRDHEARLTRTHAAYRQEQLTECRAHHLAGGILASRIDYLLWGYGGTGRQLARALAAQGRRPTGIVEVHRGRLGNRILGAPVLSPEELPPPGEIPLLASVAGCRPRQQIRQYLDERGWREGLDYLCTA